MRLSLVSLVSVLVFLGSSVSVFAQGQQYKVTGRIVDAQNKPVSYATVTLMRADSAVVNGDLTGDEGNFSIDVMAKGDYMLRVTGIGIQTKFTPGIKIADNDPQEKRVGNIKVTSTTKQLKSVEVTGERNAMEMSIDKKVFNVEKNLTSAGGSATDVLQNIPSVSVDVDGAISLRGKESIILIDGKPATMFGGDVTSALQSMPASSIQSIEVITNPSSKYDAQGTAGIINIITKRDKKFGLNGSVTAGAGTRDKYNGSLNLNLKNKKWNVFLNSSMRMNRNYNRTSNDRVNNNNPASFSSYDDNIRKFNGFFNSIGAEYTINDKNTITLTQNINKMQWGGDGISTYKVYATPTLLDSSQSRSSYNL